MTKALVLLSGGLDSLLAARVLMEQGIEVTGISYKSYFFGTNKARIAAKQLGIELIEADFSDEHLAMVKNPKHGYGKNMNPCIDCHALMLKKAREYLAPLPREGVIAQGGGYDFVATGEVLGQRPMSQNRKSLEIVEKISGLEGKLLRPLSAKLLNETILEKQRKVKRHKLLDLSGRSRKRQLELVKEYGIKEFSSPSGGCLLTESEFSEKLMKMLEYWPQCRGKDIELLRYGRARWFKNEMGGYSLMVMGRDDKDNENLERLSSLGDLIIELAEEAGPTSLIRRKKLSSQGGSATGGEVRSKNEITEIEVPKELKMSELELGKEKSDEEIIRAVVLLTGYYATKSRGKKVKMGIKTKE